MKHFHKNLFASLLVLMLAACTMPAIPASPTAPVEGVVPAEPNIAPEPTPLPVVVTFADPVLEAMVRGSIGKPEGDITLAEAQGVTRMDISDDLRRAVSEESLIHDLSGLESFSNLETLDLSNHAISDISPLRGLTKLSALSLAGSPVADISPLSELTNLKVLILSGCQASDYSVLANLVGLEVLMLDGSTISDLTPLSELTSLRQLYLADAPLEDLSPLADIYLNLEQKDFIIPSTLEELGFQFDDNTHQACFESETADIFVNHANWGTPPFNWDVDIIRITTYLDDQYKTSIGYYGIHNAYVCQMYLDGEEVVNYVYNIADGSYNLDQALRPGVEEVIRAAFDVREGDEVLHAPVRFFDDLIKSTFNMTPDKLFKLPYMPPTLSFLGFFEVKENATWLYEERGEREVNLEIHRPEWGENDFDVRFFTPLSEAYRVVILYNVNKNMFEVGADDNEQGGAKFTYYPDRGEFVDDWCSDPETSVEEYFLKAYDGSVENVYQHSIDLMVNYIRDRFGLSIDELYALPTGE